MISQNMVEMPIQSEKKINIIDSTCKINNIVQAANIKIVIFNFIHHINCTQVLFGQLIIVTY